MDPLTATLLDLLFELRDNPVPLTIAGGFGLYLKRRHLDQTGQRTLFSQLPLPRATNDLGLFVRADVLCDLKTMQFVADALARLGYEPVPVNRDAYDRNIAVLTDAVRRARLGENEKFDALRRLASLG